MGFRNYFYTLPKKEYNKWKNISFEELDRLSYEKNGKGRSQEDWEDDRCLIEPWKEGKQIYEFGKYVSFKYPEKSFKPFFKDGKLMERFSDYDLLVVNKDFFLAVINHYSENVKEYYNEMLTPIFGTLNNMNLRRGNEATFIRKWDFSLMTEDEKNKVMECLLHVKDMACEWEYFKHPYDLENDRLCKSWKYEYTIFELVRLYKTFNWNKDVLIWCGW